MNERIKVNAEQTAYDFGVIIFLVPNNLFRVRRLLCMSAAV